MSNHDKAQHLRELAALIDSYTDKRHAELLDRLEAEGMTIKDPSPRWPSWRIDIAGVRGEARQSRDLALENWARAARRHALKLEG
ncbi:hypothetical protein [Mameliella alba]|uniref:Uncharacterized protein n=1 Tax=Mameliella alba TaxID=561184 RepID=A0A0B3S0Z7_9RHOB|nr:hypothetical protein [Mameliella alba]KHQ50291.1 hypothetical protein OA50_05139 [Mameliella alba]OWV39409.1 hypothetical protein CDZ95_26135 [Mameliella alba]